MPGIDFDKVCKEISMQQVLQVLHFQARYCRSDQWYGQCPLPHCAQARHPSFSVNLAIGRYYCHRCRSHGHQLELWAAATRLPLHPATINLCTTLGKEIPWIERW